MRGRAFFYFRDPVAIQPVPESIRRAVYAETDRGQIEKLPTALATIEDRARHLEGFIRDYARFAKLPAPRREPRGGRHATKLFHV